MLLQVSFLRMASPILLAASTNSKLNLEAIFHPGIRHADTAEETKHRTKHQESVQKPSSLSNTQLEKLKTMNSKLYNIA